MRFEFNQQSTEQDYNMQLKNFEGQKIPAVSFKTRENDDWKTINSHEIFNNRTIVAFSLPGAFTPTCSSTHLPRYNELAPAFFQNGVDEIVCLSVNDAFVMNEWAKDQESENILLLQMETANSLKNSVCLWTRLIMGLGNALGDTRC